MRPEFLFILISLFFTYDIFILMLFDIIFLNFLNEDSKSLEMFQKIAPFAQKSRMEDE